MSNVEEHITAEFKWIDTASLEETVAISVVMPAFNEAAMVGQQIERSAGDGPCQLRLRVDRGRRRLVRRTANVVRQHDAVLISKKYNRGYGAALKTGIAAASTNGS